MARAVAITAITACAGTAQASVVPLRDAVITATYNGSAGAVLGLDHGFAAEAGSNTTALDPTNSGVEFFTADALFGFDFAEDGTLTIYNNAPVAAGSYSFRFDFGGTLALPITSFALLNSSVAAGLPEFSILDGGLALGLDLSAVDWGDDFQTISARIGAAEVPEPGTASVLLAGLVAMALVRRRGRAGGSGAGEAASHAMRA
ncbi:PEP-CTERM sorting domain-containing protein [Pseudoduganella namucuonensis]|nr:PEP-CTERM sorting domain-containing protein [Pseudoduganella namucuonensis]